MYYVVQNDKNGGKRREKKKKFAVELNERNLDWDENQFK